MNNKKTRIALAVAAAVGFGSLAAPASAGTGCNGVINPLVWGCAPWDNNNGPNFPYYKKTKVSIPHNKAQIFNQGGVQMVKDLRNGKVHPIISSDGAGVIAAGGLN